MGMSDVDIDFRNAFRALEERSAVTVKNMREVLDGSYDDASIKHWIESFPLSRVTSSVWGTQTDMPNSPHERKLYRTILRDGDKEIKYDLYVHVDGTIVAEPYTPADYDYTDQDPEGYKEDEDEYIY